MHEFTLEINENLKLIQNKNGLTFGTDAYLLAAFSSIGAKSLRAADLGSGTGVIPLLCSSTGKFGKIYAVEIQKGFASLIGKNAEENDLCDRIIPVCADVRELRADTLGGEVDRVTANPPYMTVGSGKRNEHDEKYIARHEVFGGIEDFCTCARRILKHGGKFYTVWRPDRLCDLMFALREHGLEPKRQIFVHAHPSAEPSMVLTEAQKGAASGMRILRPLYLSKCREDSIKNILSEDAARIYETCSFEDFIKKE